MLTTLGFVSCIINYNFVLYVMNITPHLHVVKDFWKFENWKNFEILKFSNCECFLNVDSRLLSFKSFYHQYYFIKIVFYLVLCKI